MPFILRFMLLTTLSSARVTDQSDQSDPVRTIELNQTGDLRERKPVDLERQENKTNYTAHNDKAISFTALLKHNTIMMMCILTYIYVVAYLVEMVDVVMTDKLTCVVYDPDSPVLHYVTGTRLFFKLGGKLGRALNLISIPAGVYAIVASILRIKIPWIYYSRYSKFIWNYLVTILCIITALNDRYFDKLISRQAHFLIGIKGDMLIRIGYVVIFLITHILIPLIFYFYWYFGIFQQYNKDENERVLDAFKRN